MISNFMFYKKNEMKCERRFTQIDLIWKNPDIFVEPFDLYAPVTILKLFD